MDAIKHSYLVFGYFNKIINWFLKFIIKLIEGFLNTNRTYLHVRGNFDEWVHSFFFILHSWLIWPLFIISYFVKYCWYTRYTNNHWYILLSKNNKIKHFVDFFITFQRLFGLSLIPSNMLYILLFAYLKKETLSLMLRNIFCL